MAEQHRPTVEAPEGFAAALRSAVRGESDFGAAARALMTMDASNYRRVPLGVLAPRDADDIAAALTVCREYGVPVVPRGGGTSIAGQATGTGLVLDLTRHLNAILDLDPAARTATVQPGVVLDDLRAAAAPHGLTFGPDPSTHSRCTLGGMLAKRLAGIAPERTIPVLARETYSRWLRGQQGRGAHILSSSRVVHLWADTFTEYLSPQVGRAAVRVLEEATGRTVLPPPSGVCCGLTYVSTGQLDAARRVMRRTLDRIGLLPGHPVVVLEPSCAATLRTDLPELLPDDPRAAQLASSVRTLAQYLEERAPDWTPPRLDRPAVGQTHCHQHAVMGDAAERRLRERMGLTGELSGGCCGLAGNFGFEKGHWEVSVACAEEQLLPAVRGSEPGTEVLADGFSCRTQLDQLAGRRARHLAEVIAEGLDAEAGGGR
ncbi:Lactate utilization protein A [Streptomyces microflavus]